MNDVTEPDNTSHLARPALRSANRDHTSAKAITFGGAAALMLFTVVPSITPSSASAATASHTGSASAVHMELKDPSTGGIVCTAYGTRASSPPVAQACPSGTWTEQLFDSGWRQIGSNTEVTVGDAPVGDPEPPQIDPPIDDPEPPQDDDYRRVFTEEFDGSSLSSDWETPTWPGSYRDADFRRDQCVVSADQLTVQASLDGDQVAACYARSTESFGPGSGQIKIEYRVNLSRVQAEGSWFAAWLNTAGEQGDPYDGNPATGTEIDVLEYVPFDGGYQFSSNGIDTRNSIHPAVHTGGGGGGINAPQTNGNGFYDAARLGIDIRSGWHTFGIDWSAECQVFSVDGQDFWTNRDGVSSAEVHRLLLTMEMDSADGDGYNLWGFASGDFADNLRTSPAEARVDRVTVDEKSSPDAGLCNG